MTSSRTSASAAPAWGRAWLRAAGIYNVAWGAFVILAPHAMFDAFGMQRLNYPEIWQCVGMIVGVYGVGYWIAASDSRRHWPIVLVGLLGKLLGPLGFAAALARGVFPPQFGLTILTNDLVWWIPFGMLLWDAARCQGEHTTLRAPTLAEALDGVRSAQGRSLRELSEARPLLVVLTRHSGCTFCRETLAELARRQTEIRARGFELGIVSMSSAERNAQTAREYGLESAAWFSDPERVAYRALELQRGTFRQLFGLGVFLRGVGAALRGHGIGALDGDGFQMPGAFVLHEGRVVRAFRHSSAADRTDYDALTCKL